MDLNKLTLKSQEALRSAREQAAARDHAQIEPAHLLFALLADPEGVTASLLHRMGQSPRALRERVEELLDRLPKVYGGQEVGLSPATQQVLERAFTEASSLTDEYVSTEHLFLALLGGGTTRRPRLTAPALARDPRVPAPTEGRGLHGGPDENAAETYQGVEPSR